MICPKLVCSKCGKVIYEPNGKNAAISFKVKADEVICNNCGMECGRKGQASNEEKEQWMKLYKEGVSLPEIAKQFSRQVATIERYCTTNTGNWFPKGFTRYKPGEYATSLVTDEEIEGWLYAYLCGQNVKVADIATAFGRTVKQVTAYLDYAAPIYYKEIKQKQGMGYNIEQVARKLNIPNVVVRYIFAQR